MSKKGDDRQARPVVTDVSAVKVSGAYWVTRSYAEIADLISEGPIEGIVSGDYSYLASENKTGYDNVTFSQYLATGAAGGEALPELGFLRSIYWNEVPIVDKHGYFNFQDINVEHNFGNPIGDLPSLSANLGDGNDFDLSVERGIGERLFGPQVKGFEKGSAGSEGVDYSPGRQGAEDARKATLEGAIDRYAKTYTIYNKECSNLQVNIKVDALYEQILAGKKLYEDPSELKPCHEADVGYGDTKARTIIYNVYYMALFDERFNPARADANQEDGAFTDLWNLAKTEKIQGKVDFPYIRTTDIDIPTSYKDTPGFQGWKIRIVRLTPESLSSFLTNRSFVHSIVEVYGTRLRYPYTSMVYSRFDARNFNRIPARAYDTRLLKVKVPSNYNPICKTYGDSDAENDLLGQKTGARYISSSSTWVAQRGVDAPNIFWDGEFKKDARGEYIREWTDNAAWCFYDLVTNSRYGLGEYIKETDVDKWSLYEIAQYCDGMVPDGFGSYEPRFSMNYIITSREEAFKVLNDLSSMFRGITYYAHGSIFAVQDKYRDPVFQFNNSNVTQGDFTYSSSSKKARHSVAIIRYNDKRDFFRPAVEYMEDEESVRKYGILELETTALGCTSKGQARRFGKWILASESEETETVQFSIGHEGGLIRPGDVIQIYDNFRSPLKRSGRTNVVRPTSTTTYFGAGANTVTGNSVILDSALEFTAGKGYNFSLLTPTFSYNTTQITGLNSSGINEINRSQIQNLVFSGQHTRVITGSYKSEYYEGGSGICTEIYFHTGEDLGGLSNQLDFDNYVITGYTNTGVVTELEATVADYSGGCFSGENLIWSVEPSSTEDPEFLSGNFSNFRIINIKETDDNNYAVSALAYSTGKYDSVDSSIKLRDLSYYDIPEFPTGKNDSTSAAVLPTNTSLNLTPDTPYQKNIENTEYKSIKIDFDKAGYNRDEPINDEGEGFTSRVDISDELTYFVSITTTGNPNQHHTPTKDNLYTVPTSDYKNIYKTNTNLIITPEDTLYTDVVTEGKILAEVLITEKENYYVTVFAANGAGRLSQGIQRMFDVTAIGNLTFFSAVNHVTVSNLVTQGIIDSSFPSEDYLLSGAKVQEGISAGEPGFIWTVGFENALLNAPVDNNEGPDGPDGVPGDIPTYPLQMFENEIDWRITVRAPSRKLEDQPSSPNNPSNVIYLEFTGYQSDPSFPSFVFTTDYNNPALIDDLRSRDLTIAGSDITGYKADGFGITTDNTVDEQGNREVAYYLVDPSGMIVKNDFNAFPLREFDIVVEPHDKDGRTSQGHYVWSNTIYNSINSEDPVNLQRGAEQFNLSSVNNKYDIFGTIIAPPSGVIFVPTQNSTTMNTLLGGENDNFISPEDAYARNIPYVASALLLPDGSFTIGVEPSENLQGAQLYTEEELADTFGSSRGMVFYYTVGTGARSARDFTIAPENIPTYTAKSTSEESAGGQAFGGIVSNIENGTRVYRGFYVFGENDSPARLSLKIPQIKGKAENINICAALFDTLSLAKSFTPETRRPRFYRNDALEGTPLIFLDRDMNFNVRASASTGAEYKINKLGQLDLTPQDGVIFGELNRPIKITEFSMISPTQQGLSNQSWGQLYIDLSDFSVLKNVVGYEEAVKKNNQFYRPRTDGGTVFISEKYDFPLQTYKSLRMWEGGCHTLPMMLANAYCREFLEEHQKIVPLGRSDIVIIDGQSTWYQGHEWQGMDMSKEPWFIMGYQDPRQYDVDSRSLYQGYLPTTYTSETPGPRLNPDLTLAQRKVVDADGVDKMKALLDSITYSKHFGGFHFQSSARVGTGGGGQGLGNVKRWYNPNVEGNRLTTSPDEPQESLYDAEVRGKLFWPFTTALNPDFIEGVTSTDEKYTTNPTAPIWRTVYEIPFVATDSFKKLSITQNIDINEIYPKLKIIEISQPDLPHMLMQPGGKRSPTGWRVKHYAYVEVTVYFQHKNNATNKYIVNPLEGYMGSTRETFETEGLEGILYDSAQRFGEYTSEAKGNEKTIWQAEAGGLIKMPHDFGPRLIRKNPTSFTFVLGAPSSSDGTGGDSLLLSDWIGPQALNGGVVDSNLGFNLINFAVLKSTQ